MFGPIAAAYPSQARAILSLDVSNLAPLVLFGVLCLSFTLGLLKAANSVWGAMSESSYTLVAGGGRFFEKSKVLMYQVWYLSLLDAFHVKVMTLPSSHKHGSWVHGFGSHQKLLKKMAIHFWVKPFRSISLPAIPGRLDLLPSCLGTFHSIIDCFGCKLHDLLLCSVLQASRPCGTVTWDPSETFTLKNKKDEESASQTKWFWRSRIFFQVGYCYKSIQSLEIFKKSIWIKGMFTIWGTGFLSNMLMSPVSSWGVSPRHTVSLNPGTFKANGSCRHKWPGDFGETIHVASWKQWKSEIGAKVPSLWPSALPKLVNLQKFGVKGCESVGPVVSFSPCQVL